MKEKELIHVGTFGQPQGLKGDIKINIFTSSLESFKTLKKYYLQDKKSVLVFKAIRQVGKKIIGSIEECKNRDMALSFKGKHILVLRNSFPETKDYEYYIVDLIGCEVLDINNKILGVVEDVKNFGAGDLIEINYPNKKNFYIPMDKDNLISVNIVKKTIIVDPIVGLLN
jgi:16S rRNA processing protein RimM